MCTNGIQAKPVEGEYAMSRRPKLELRRKTNPRMFHFFVRSHSGSGRCTEHPRNRYIAARLRCSKTPIQPDVSEELVTNCM
mmetsp:Transcript_32524/g.127560  ORF Transcript_32524/g.127560 Transcript_32524/m.127560 type:complete len:81 (+) Transcript_32524:2697-2939(+)